ncbi:MAG: DUF1343 domain-containing protein [Armatimonadetes bacterium]|nr:DUF1343 domain-containing protein [Armatimonadota bacterium]
MVKTGLDLLLSEHIDEIRGRGVGVVPNQASVTRELLHIKDALKIAGVTIAALFSPEHGIDGNADAGARIVDSIDDRLGLPVYSLYGENKKPSVESLRPIDVMIFDLQGVGARFYTYESTLANVMAACGEAGIPVWVPDRPNPISGTNPEGPVLEPEFASFIGMFPIPIRHGLTMGELARLIAERFGVKCDLKVIPMQGWSREMFWNDTGLRWLKPSPGIVEPVTALVYPGMCLLEGTNASEGRGTPTPFELAGAPWADPRELRNALEEWHLPGVTFRAAYFTPTKSKCEGRLCGGVQIHVSDPTAFRPVLTGVALICALAKLWPKEFEFLPPGEDGRRHFDLLAGTDRLRNQIEAGESPSEIAASWEEGVSDYWRDARGVLLY